MARLRRVAAARARALRAGDRRARHGLRHRRHRRRRRRSLQLRPPWSIAARSSAFCPKEKLPTYNIFYEARTFSRGAPGLDARRRGRAARRRDLRVRLRHGRARGLRGHLVARRPDAAPLLLGRGARAATSRRRPSAPAITATRREMIATRASDNQCTIAYANLVGANDGLVFDGGGLRQPERPARCSTRRASARARRRAVVDLDRTTRCRREASTWRSDLEAFRDASTSVPTARVAGRPAIAVSSPTRRRRAARRSSCPARRAAGALRPRRAARRFLRGARARRRRLLPRRRARFKLDRRRALGRSRLAPHVSRARGAPSQVVHAELARAALRAKMPRAAPRVLHADALTRATRPRPPPRRSPTSSARRSRCSRSRTPSRASSRPPGRCSARRAAHRAHLAEHPGAHPRNADVELGEHERRVSSCRPAT